MKVTWTGVAPLAIFSKSLQQFLDVSSLLAKLRGLSSRTYEHCGWFESEGCSTCGRWSSVSAVFPVLALGIGYRWDISRGKTQQSLTMMPAFPSGGRHARGHRDIPTGLGWGIMRRIWCTESPMKRDEKSHQYIIQNFPIEEFPPPPIVATNVCCKAGRDIEIFYPRVRTCHVLRCKRQATILCINIGCGFEYPCHKKCFENDYGYDPARTYTFKNVLPFM